MDPGIKVAPDAYEQLNEGCGTTRFVHTVCVSLIVVMCFLSSSVWTRSLSLCAKIWPRLQQTTSEGPSTQKTL
jgi:hypothetical protein